MASRMGRSIAASKSARSQRVVPAAMPGKGQLLALDPVDGSGKRDVQRAQGRLLRLVAAAADLAVLVEAEVVDLAQRQLARFAVELDARHRRRRPARRAAPARPRRRSGRARRPVPLAPAPSGAQPPRACGATTAGVRARCPMPRRSLPDRAHPSRRRSGAPTRASRASRRRHSLAAAWAASSRTSAAVRQKRYPPTTAARSSRAL